MQTPAASSVDHASAVPSPAPGDWRGRTFGVDAWRFGGALGVATALSVAQFLLLPRVLDVPTYGAFRVFVVYGVYAGVLHLGLPDGAYVRWAGRAPGQVLAEWRRIAGWLTALQAAVVAVALVVATQVSSPRLAVTIAALGGFAAAANLVTLGTCALQAIGEFRRAGMLAVVPPAALLAGVLVLPPGSRTLAAVLAVAVVAQLIPAVLATSWLRRARRAAGDGAVRDGIRPVEGGAPGTTGTTDVRDGVSPAILLHLGVPVLAANLVTGLAQSADRLLLSFAIPVEQFALYGFATSALVVANAVTQSFARVALPHGARLAPEARPAFYARLHALIAAGFGAGLALYPLVESVVAGFLPAYVAALPIVRALLPGTLVGVALNVVVFTSLLLRKAVRAQLAIAALVAALVFLASGAAIVAAVPLWMVAAAASGALATGWAIGTFIAHRDSANVASSGAGWFALTGLLQLAALAVALHLADAVAARTAIYAVLAAGPTIVAWRRAR